LSNHTETLAQTAVRCYLTTLLNVTDCLAQTCPEVGMTFKRRWARAPQRIGFDSTPEALEGSRQEFERDLRAYAGYAGQYFRPAVPLAESIAENGVSVANALHAKLQAHAVLLETLAESLNTIADLEADPALRAALEHRPAGLLNCARQVEREMVPLVEELRGVVGQCEELVQRSREVLLVAVETGFLNSEGFEREFERKSRETAVNCLVQLRIDATEAKGQPCSDALFAELMNAMAPAVFEQFRSSESIGLWDRQVSVIFAGTQGQAEGRKTDIERRLAGIYKLGDSRLNVAVAMSVV